MSRNRFSGTCYRCKGHVAPGEGHFEKVSVMHIRRDPSLRGKKWRLQHASCAIEHRGTDKGNGEAPQGKVSR